jgi:hypothetical protein
MKLFLIVLSFTIVFVNAKSLSRERRELSADEEKDLENCFNEDYEQINKDGICARTDELYVNELQFNLGANIFFLV